jgi:hypothetical protein
MPTARPGTRRPRECAVLNLAQNALERIVRSNATPSLLRKGVVGQRLPAKLAVHVIVDNYAAHKHPKVLEWLGRHPRFVFHFTPTSLAQRRRRFVRAPGQTASQTWRFPFSPGTQAGDPWIHRRQQCEPKALHLDKRTRQVHRRHEGTKLDSIR